MSQVEDDDGLVQEAGDHSSGLAGTEPRHESHREPLDCLQENPLPEVQAPQDLAQLEFNTRRAWKLLGKDKELLFNLCDSMERRIDRLVEVEGGHTKY